MPTITREQLNDLISNGRIEQALKLLDNATRNDSYLNQQVLLQKSRYSGLKKNETTGVRSTADLALESNRINAALFELTAQLPENINVTLPVESIIWQEEGSENTPPSSQPTSKTTATNLPVWIGLGLFLIGLAMIFFVPCPTDAQLFGARLSMALGAAGVATIIPGVLKIQAFKNIVSAGGALGVGALIYLFNPADGLADTKGCQEAFTFTAKIKTESPSQQYPPLENAQLELFLNNKWEDAPIQADGLADFKGIDAEFDNQRVEARLTADFWELATDSVLLVPNQSTQLVIVPDGSLGIVNGKIFDGNTKAPISGIVVEILGITDTSNRSGNFRLSIPLSLQQKTYEIYGFKEGYETYSDKVTIGVEEAIKVFLNSNSSSPNKPAKKSESYILEGTVNNEKGDPVSGAIVNFRGRKIVTNSSGEFSLTLSDNIEGVLSVNKSGYSEWSRYETPPNDNIKVKLTVK